MGTESEYQQDAVLELCAQHTYAFWDDIDKHAVEHLIFYESQPSTTAIRQTNAEAEYLESLRKCIFTIRDRGISHTQTLSYTQNLPTPTQVPLQNISVPAPPISLFPLRVLDGRKPSVEPRQLLNGLGITYITG